MTFISESIPIITDITLPLFLAITLTDRLQVVLEMVGQDKFKRDFKGASDTVKGESKGMGGSIKEFAGSAVGSFTAVAAAVVAVGAAAIALAKQVAQLGDSFADMSQRTGVSTESLSTLGYAAQRSGSDIGALEGGLRKLAKNAYDAKNGVGEAKDGFLALGISVVNANGELKASDALFLELADKFKGLKNDTEAAALAQEIFGRSGAALVPLLKEGADGIGNMQQRARELGIEMSGKLAKDSSDFEDAWLDATEAIKGAGIAIGKTLIPAFTQLINNAITPSITLINAVIGKLTEVQRISKEMQDAAKYGVDATGVTGSRRIGTGVPGMIDGRMVPASPFKGTLAEQMRAALGAEGSATNVPAQYSPNISGPTTLAQRLRNPALGVVSDEDILKNRAAVAERNKQTAIITRQAQLVRSNTEIQAKLLSAEQEVNEELFKAQSMAGGKGSYNVSRYVKGSGASAFTDALAGDMPSARGVVTGQSIGPDGNVIKVTLKPELDPDSLRTTEEIFGKIPESMESSFDNTIRNMDAALQAFGLRGQGIFGNIANIRAGAMTLGAGKVESGTAAGQLLKGISGIFEKVGAWAQIFAGSVGIFKSIVGATPVAAGVAAPATLGASSSEQEQAKYNEEVRIAREGLGSIQDQIGLLEERAKLFPRVAEVRQGLKDQEAALQSNLDALLNRGAGSSGSQSYNSVNRVTEVQADLFTAQQGTMIAIANTQTDLQRRMVAHLANIEVNTAVGATRSRFESFAG